MNKKEKILVILTTYNQSDVTKRCLESLQLISDQHDVLIIDDASSDNTIELCKEYNVDYITKDIGKGLTDSWNKGYQYFKENGYEYFVIANNDILIPDLALTEMKNVLSKWPCSLVAPLSTELGAGHNEMQRINKWYGPNEYDTPENYIMVQQLLFDVIKEETESNNLYKFDPIRMKHFNGFFFMMSKDICQYERPDGNLFDPVFINVKNEDEFNWGSLIPNNDFPMLCKTAFIFHWKGMSFTKAGIGYNNNLKEYLEQRENKFNTTKQKQS